MTDLFSRGYDGSCSRGYHGEEGAGPPKVRYGDGGAGPRGPALPAAQFPFASQSTAPRGISKSVEPGTNRPPITA